MNIDYIAPLTNAWNRMVKALFKPFDIAKWFVVGFTAFLAGLMEYNGGAGSNNTFERNSVNDGLHEFFTFPETAREWLIDHPVWATLIFAGLVFVFLLLVVFTWLSSRGKFMFLDNVVHDKAEVSAPWKEYSKEGNSLFIWRLIFGLLSFFVTAASLYYAYMHFREMYFDGVPLISALGNLLGIIFWMFIVFIVIAYISLFLTDFVVPVMYKHRLSASRAWFKFMSILWPKLGYFLLYGLFVFLLAIVVAMLIVAFGFLTCCIGFLLLIIPYIGSVILLPISYTYRAYSVEFLAQFGEEFNLNGKAVEMQ